MTEFTAKRTAILTASCGTWRWTPENRRDIQGTAKTDLRDKTVTSHFKTFLATC